MNRWMAMALFVWLSMAIPVLAIAKGATARIDITGADLSAALAITDRDILDQFSIWNGPGTQGRINGELVKPDYSTAFIDWPRGEADDKPEGLTRFRIEFFIEGISDQEPECQTYKAFYEVDPDGNGYMYLPTHREVDGNTSFIYQGVEGHWFYSSENWEAIVRPFIEQAMAAK